MYSLLSWTSRKIIVVYNTPNAITLAPGFARYDQQGLDKFDVIYIPTQ